ncbi:hypothetical protein CK203_064067 [Vitis vinifera]|uniref:Retrotransposon gag domain-containing protein n=1 Tax=Vitis vinifera TaxID=29760 RepID=A0A438G452_VITVI|nr:hypothetical protein CK203_064067 [Vitis vinifera]
MQENESLREFVKRFGQAVLQVEAYNMDAILQIFKRSICLGTPFFESRAKSLLRRWTTYSGAPSNTQCSKMTCEQLPSKSWLPGRHPEAVRKEVPKFRIGQGRPVEGKKNKAARNCHHSHPFPYLMRSFSL